MPEVTVNVPDTSSQPKAGIQSTEFWVTLVAGLWPIVESIQGALPPAQAAQYAVIAGTAYTTLRTLLKGAHALGYAKQLPDLPDSAKQ